VRAGKRITGLYTEPDTRPLRLGHAHEPVAQVLLRQRAPAFLDLGLEASFHDVQQIDGGGSFASESDAAFAGSLRAVGQIGRHQDVPDVLPCTLHGLTASL
jgi:hypothetical protein